MSAIEARRKGKCFIYCRTSVDGESKDTSDKVSIEEQELNGRKLAKRHNLEVVDVFIDRNRSSRVYPTGYSIPDPAVDEYCRQCNFSERQRTRDALGQMISRLDEVSTIIVRNLDRIMRPEFLSYLDTHLLNLFRNAGIVILSRDGTLIDPSNSRDVSSARSKSSADGDAISQRILDTRAALKELRDTGRPYFSTTFYGFRYTAPRRPPDRIEPEIAVVRRIFAEFVESNNIAKIVQGLNSGKGRVPPPTTHRDSTKVKGVSAWNISTVRNILRRPQYAGFQYRSDGTEVQTPYFHPPVVDRDTFDQVMAIFKRRSLDPQNRNRELHALSGLVRCGYCGYNMQIVGTTKKSGNGAKIRYFRCKKVIETDGRTGCARMSIRERMPEQLVVDGLVSSSMAYGLEDCLYPLIYKGIHNLMVTAQRRDGLEQEIVDAEQQFTRARQNVLEADQQDFREAHGLAADLIFGQRTKAFNEASQRLERLQRELDNVDHDAVPIPTFDEFANARLDDRTKKIYFARSIDHVKVFDDRIEVHMVGACREPFTLYREYVNGSWSLPRWIIQPMDTGFVESHPLPDNGRISRVRTKSTKRTKQTKYQVIYEYQKPGGPIVVFGDGDLVVLRTGYPALKPD